VLYLAKESEEQILQISERWENGGKIFSVEPSGGKRA
jgi:hypothetical protein